MRSFLFVYRVKRGYIWLHMYIPVFKKIYVYPA